MEPTALLTTSPRSECQLLLEIERCEREIAAAEDALRASHSDVAGLCLAISDWSVERRILEQETAAGHSTRGDLRFREDRTMAGGKRNGSGRKKVTISLEEVEKLAAIQCTDVEIAAFFGVSVRTIERRKSQAAFAEAIERGKAKGRRVASPVSVGPRGKGHPGRGHFSVQESARLQRLFRKRVEWSQRRCHPSGSGARIRGIQ